MGRSRRGGEADVSRDLPRRRRGSRRRTRLLPNPAWRTSYDREILRLAIPALGALAAEPLYILVDTAIVGHLGREQLAALGAAATALSVLAAFNFLQYGTTAQVARAKGAGQDEIARRLGAQALWLSLGVGVVLAAAIAALADPIVGLVGVDGRTADYAVTYLRIVSLGVPSFFLALGGQGFLRGVSDLASPLVLIVLGNALNVVLEVLFVYGFEWGIEGSAWGTAIAQSCMGLGFVWLIVRRVGRVDMRPVAALARRLLGVGKFILVRTTALISAFLLAGAVVARFGDAELGAYQISFQLWIFLALVLDAIAIAGQIIVGRELGAGRPQRAYEASVRMITLSVAAGAAFAVLLLVLADALPRVFTDDAAVLAQCALLWPIFAAMQPLNGAVFALDGILIGASDGPYIAASMIVALLACGAALVAAVVGDWGVRGVWAALVVLIAVRLATMGARFVRRRWLVTGWT
jgi:putative MATE family efflux protein